MSSLELQPHAGRHLATLRVDGVVPITRNEYGKARASYQRWIAALKDAASQARDEMKAEPEGPFSLRVEMRLYTQWDQGSDLDNYIKDIQDALGHAGVFGPSVHARSTMKGDEHIDHLEMRRKSVSTPEDAGVLAEVWSLD